MWSKFRQRGKSVNLEASPVTGNAKGESPVPQLSMNDSEDDEEEGEEVRN